MKATKTIELDTTCFACGRKNDMATGIVGEDQAAIPSDGDVSICFSCGEIAEFKHEGNKIVLQRLTDEERSIVEQLPQVQAIKRAMLSAKVENKPGAGHNMEERLNAALKLH